MEVLIAPHPILKTKTKPVKKITPELLSLVKEMIKLTKTFKDPEGVGLASTQIGRTENFFVVKDGKKFIAVFNARIIDKSQKTKTFFEGCLSIPNYYGEVKRPVTITAEYSDESNKKIVKKLTGIRSWIFQHEIDHINGRLFMDLVLEQKGRVFKVVGKDQAGADIFEEVRL